MPGQQNIVSNEVAGGRCLLRSEDFHGFHLSPYIIISI